MLLLACCGWLLADVPQLAAQGFAPNEAPRRMTVSEGLEVSLVAAEPLVRQPVAIEFDDRGRLWVIEYLQYPNPAGLKRAKVDRYSRTTYDRVPEPPPKGPRGSDRILILEDQDQDGRAETAREFVTGLNLASGLAFGHGGVFVLQVPYLLFYPDADGDDHPDADPTVLLTGFGMEDAHSVANSLTWGPDGWLYGCQGSTVTSRIRGIEFQQGVWRYHPVSQRFELFCEGGGNSWGLDFDAHGNLFYSTNYGGNALLHGVQGAYYWKQFGKHGALHNPYAFGYFDHVPHQKLKGGHVTVGGVIYQGDALADLLRGRYVAADLLGHAVYWHALHERGSTFAATWAGDLLQANDTWFAPSDVTVGPDGAIYVCDWHDARTAHPDPDAEWDRANGRIYRIGPRGAKPPATRSLAALSSQELLGELSQTNDWYVRKARRLLADRRDPTVTLPLMRKVLESNDGHLALEAMWALLGSGGFSQDLAEETLGHLNPDIRWWTVRWLGDGDAVEPRLASRLVDLAMRDDSPAVLAQLAATCQRLPADQALPIIAALGQRDGVESDPYVPLLLWWGLERHAIAAREAVLKRFASTPAWQYPVMRDTLLPRLIRRYAAAGDVAGYQACAQLLTAAPATEHAALWVALNAGLDDRHSKALDGSGTLFTGVAAVQASGGSTLVVRDAFPPELTDVIDRAWRAETTDLALVRLAARMGRPAAAERLVALARDTKSAAEVRRDAIGALGTLGQPWSVDALLELLRGETPNDLQAAAIDALGRYDDPRIATSLLAHYVTFGPALRAKTRDVLLSRRVWAGMLLAAVDQRSCPADDFALDQLRVVAVHQDAALDALVKKHWGAIQRGTPEQRLAEMRRINNDLRAAQGNPAAGHALFLKHCGTCHRLFGEGNTIGPELTHANRKKTDELLATIVDPSAVIRKEFLSYVAQTHDGRALTGLLVEQTPGAVTLLSAKNERITLPRDSIETLQESPVSLMPENLLSALKPAELRDLFSYLQGDPPAGAAPEREAQAAEQPANDASSPPPRTKK